MASARGRTVRRSGSTREGGERHGRLTSFSRTTHAVSSLRRSPFFRPTKSGKYKGVYASGKEGQYMIRITIDGIKEIHGPYASEVEAAKAFDR